MEVIQGPLVVMFSPDYSNMQIISQPSIPATDAIVGANGLSAAGGRDMRLSRCASPQLSIRPNILFLRGHRTAEHLAVRGASWDSATRTRLWPVLQQLVRQFNMRYARLFCDGKLSWDNGETDPYKRCPIPEGWHVIW